ncbi:MAG: hypothetical protein IJ849_09855 [Selenomonadaceae bacterium]|nr:hypothetical protein [Selenomonadaceae bacterium]
MAEPSATAYDDSFRTLLNDCRELIIPVVNEAFGEHYTGREKVIFAPNEQYLSQDGGVLDKRITDSNFVIVSSGGAVKRYHIECETDLDASIVVRIFEYDAQIALQDGMREGYTFTVSFPHSAVIALRYSDKTPDTMRVKVKTPGGETGYDVPIVKVQKYSLEEIFDRRLLFFLPFYIFSHEKQFQEYEDNAAKFKQLTDEYKLIQQKLDELQKAGKITAYTKNALCAAITHVLALIARNYQNVREGVEHIVKGKLIDYEAKDILRKGFNDGLEKGREEGREEGIIASIRSLMETLGFNAQKAMDALKIPLAEQKQFSALINA